MNEEPEHVTLLRSLLALANNRTAIPGMAQNEMGSQIEKYLIEYGFQEPFSDDAETDVVETNSTQVEWIVRHGSGHLGRQVFDNEQEARDLYEHESAVPSYFKAYEGQKQSASIQRITTIYDRLERNR